MLDLGERGGLLVPEKERVSAVQIRVEWWRKWPHDDLVRATAIAAWQGQRCQALRLWIL